MNSFCIYCVGGHRKEHISIIKGCDDMSCPFHPYRFADLDHEDEKEISIKLLGEIGLVK